MYAPYRRNSPQNIARTVFLQSVGVKQSLNRQEKGRSPRSLRRMRGRLKQMLFVLLRETHAPLVVVTYAVFLDQTIR